MTIAFINDTYFPYSTGGAEESVHALARALSGQLLQIVVITPDLGPPEKTGKRLVFRRFPTPFRLKKRSLIHPILLTTIFFQLYSAFWIWKICREEGVRVLHVHGKYMIIPSVLTHFFLRVPIVATIRDYIPLCPYGLCLLQSQTTAPFLTFIKEEFPFYLRTYVHSTNPFVLFSHLTFGVRGWFVSFAQRTALQFANQRIFISEAQERIFKRNGIDGIVIGNVIMPHPYRRKQLQRRSVLYAGRLTYGKGIRTLIECLPLLLQKFPSIVFHIAGTGPEEERVRRQVSSLGFVRHVVFHGFLQSAKLAGLMASVDAVVVPSLWPEPFGRVAAEALLCGTPVVSSNRGGLPAIVQDRKTGRVVDPERRQLARAIADVLTHNAAYRKRVRAAQTFLVTRYGEAIVRAHRALYTTVVRT